MPSHGKVAYNTLLETPKLDLISHRTAIASLCRPERPLSPQCKVNAQPHLQLQYHQTASMEFHLRAEIKRVEEEYRQTGIRVYEARIAMRTTHLLAVGIYDMFAAVQKGKADYKSPEQFTSDFEAVEKLWLQTERNHQAALNKHYDLDYAFQELYVKLKALDRQLEELMEGKVRWERADERPAPSTGGHPRQADDERTRTFYNPQTSKEYKFKKTWPPPPPPSPPPRSRSPPPRSRSPPPRPSRSPPLSSESPPLKKPTPFRRPSCTRPSQSRIDNWFDEVEIALANPITVRSFPQPPTHWTCSRRKHDGLDCPIVALGLCACCMALMFEGRDLKADRTKFHPDKFSRCPENVRERIQRDASDVFKFVDGLYREEVEQKKRGGSSKYY